MKDESSATNSSASSPKVFFDDCIGLMPATGQLTSASAIHHFQFGLQVINLSVVLIFKFCNFIQLWSPANDFQIPPQMPMRNVGGNRKPHLCRQM
jgi:hypothetical protein